MAFSLSWVLLICAGLFEVIWVFFLKRSDGLSKLVPSLFFILSLTISMLLLALSMRSIPMSLSYPIWTGIGAIGSVVVGYFVFNESLDLIKLIFLLFIVVGIVGLKYASGES